MSNPIKLAIEALEESGAWAPGVGRAMDILRSLQKEVEGVELPDPKYIYHNSEMPGEDELFEFVDSGALDEDCPHCERLYTADQLRAAVAAALGRGAVPQDDGGWLPFDYGNPPDDGLMFVAVSAPETDCDVDDYGRTVGWHTGEVEHSVCMVLFSAGDGGEHDFHPVAEWETGKVPADGVVTHYAPVRLPAIPKEVAAPSPEATQPTQAEAPSEREALDVDDLCGMLSAASVDFANGDYGQGQYKIGEAIRYARAALATQQAVQGEPVAFEFYNPATGHAIVDYSRQTHVGPLTKEMGYEARPLGYVTPPPAAVKPSDPVPLWQALEALDSLEESSRGDAPYNHFAADLVRSALEQAATPPAPGQVERDKEDGPCPDGLLPDGEICPRCGGKRGPSGVDGGSWVHIRAARSSEGGGKS